MEILEATEFDIPAILTFGHYFHDISDYGKFQTYDHKGLKKNLFDVIQNPDASMWVAWDNNKLAGAIMGMLIPNFYDPSQIMAECGFLAVLPKYGSKHIGKKLRHLFEQWAVNSGASILMYSGYSRKFITALKREDFTQTEVTLMKKVEK